MPMKRLISFHKILEYYDAMATSDDAFLAAKAKRIVNAQAPYPELREGFEDLTILEKHESLIRLILEDAFSEILGANEIKTASLPYDDLVFNSSKRFKKIIADAGPGFVPRIRNQEQEVDYIMAAVVVLNFYYGFNLDFLRPYFYDIPDAKGIMHHYRILYNADFLEILPTDKAKDLTQDDVDELLDNYDNIDLWKEKIPPGSFISKGFVISNMFDVTAEQSISRIKSNLIADNKQRTSGFMDELGDTFRSFFRIKDINTGFVTYNGEKKQFERVNGNYFVESTILGDSDYVACKDGLCQNSYRALLTENKYFAISDVAKYFKLTGGEAPYANLHTSGFKSAIFAPIANKGELLGVLELTSIHKNALNSVTATKLDDIMPYIVTAVLRAKAEEENLIDAVIQNECTSVHSSVYWRFKEEAKRFVKLSLQGEQPSFKEIVFADVKPLYGQIDIKDSSKARNVAIQRDLLIQLSEIKAILTAAFTLIKLPIYEALIFRVSDHIDEIKYSLHTNTEQLIFDFVRDEIKPVFDHLKEFDSEFKASIVKYESEIDPDTNSYYDHRRNYDQSVMLSNKKLAAVLDKKQEHAQAMFPHYFERYKTDGIEHNMYIGAAIAGQKKYDPIYLHNLRLWQLQVMCEMENWHYSLKPELPVSLDVASLILVHSSALSIRFRMDEKRFDVDGAYNARYEIIKKRIDKSFIKGRNERLTQTGKMAIVYSQKSDELEYLRYIKFLKSKGYFTGKVEIVELDSLQGVSGLKAIRAEILYKKNIETERTYTYQDLMEELKN